MIKKTENSEKGNGNQFSIWKNKNTTLSILTMMSDIMDDFNGKCYDTDLWNVSV